MSLPLSIRIARHKKPCKPILSLSSHLILRRKQQHHFHTTSVSYKKRLDDVFKTKIRSSPIPKSTLHKSSFSFPEEYPQLFALPIMRKPLFPGFYRSIFIRDPFVVSVIKGLIKRGQPYIGAFLIRKEEVDIDIITSMEQVYQTGVFAQITNIFSTTQNDETGYSVILYPHRRIKMNELVLTSDVQFMGKMDDSIKWTNTNPPPKLSKKSYSSFNPTKNDLFEEHMISLGNVENLIEPPFCKTDPMIQAIVSEISTGFKEIAGFNPAFRDQIFPYSTIAKVFNEPSKLADFTASISVGGEPFELQQILDTTSVEKRLQLSLEVLKKELGHVRLQEQISKDADSQITKRQRESFLLNELEKIKKELGLDSDMKQKWMAIFKERADGLSMTESAQKVYHEELLKLSHLQPSMPEFNVTRDYLDSITQIPWGKTSVENNNIKRAREILEEDHYGLKDIKDHILEFIAMNKLRNSAQGKILCLCGPPGVGKTSIGKSMARALDRPFFRFSVGGLTDVAEIKGHRKTYIGAMPGKIVNALKKVQTENPLILIDEIDKISTTGNSAPASALLELLDPEQNDHFLDHYIDIPIDLSKVLFVCTANTLDTIPVPLLDRMEIVRLSGYTFEEKEKIALRHLVPTCKVNAGLCHADVALTHDAVHKIINGYCHEDGVRGLKNKIDKVFRKVAFQMVQEQESHSHFQIRSDQQQDKTLLDDVSSSLELNANHLKNYLGPEKYHSHKLYEKDTPPGTIMALARTDAGSTVFIESVLESCSDHGVNPQLSTTGFLGDVVKESTLIAYTFSKSLLARKFPKNAFFDTARIHLHCPSGSASKDDPSAGMAMTTSLLSLAFNQPVSSNMAMTGEMTITGKVLKVDGLRDKIVAAKRSNIDTIFYPKDNQQDWVMLDADIKKGINGVPVSTYDDVFHVVFKNKNTK